MSKVYTVTNAFAYDIQVPLIGRDGDTVTVPAGSSDVEISAESIEWYTEAEVSKYYTDETDGVFAQLGLSYSEVESGKSDIEVVVLKDGAAESGATVAVADTDITATTDSSGKCTLEGVDIGSATITINTNVVEIDMDVVDGGNKLVVSYVS